MNHGPYRALTGVDYEVSRQRARPRRLQLLLGIVAVTAFGSAWLLRDEASASASEASNAQPAQQQAVAALAPNVPGNTAPVSIPTADVIASASPAHPAPVVDAAAQAGSAASQLAALPLAPAGAQAASEASAGGIL